MKENYGLNVTFLNIEQIKDKCGLDKRDNYCLGTEGHKVPKCTPEKERAIVDAFKHFKLI